jgi:hypothetical protein
VNSAAYRQHDGFWSLCESCSRWCGFLNHGPFGGERDIDGTDDIGAPEVGAFLEATRSHDRSYGQAYSNKVHGYRIRCDAQPNFELHLQASVRTPSKRLRRCRPRNCSPERKPTFVLVPIEQCPARRVTRRVRVKELHSICGMTGCPQCSGRYGVGVAWAKSGIAVRDDF